MVPTPWTSIRRSLPALTATTILTLLVLLLTVQLAPAASIAQLAARLADDTQQLADARAERDRVAEQLRATRREHRELLIEVEDRLVAIYKHGNRPGALTTVAGGGSMRDMGISMEVLDQVAEHDEHLLHRWQELDAKLEELRARRSELDGKIRRAEQRVRTARQKLSAAEARAERARREAAKMARIADSPLLPKAGHPETTAAATASTGSSAPTSAAAQPIGFHQSGVASMYHDSFTGQRTANGEIYDPNAFTAAHPSLPFGTWVNVSGPGGTISVRINDRGPFIGGRVIDLSRAAANAIALPGIAQVELSVAA